MFKKRIFLLLISCLVSLLVSAQDQIADTSVINYDAPKEYIVGSLQIEGAPSLDNTLLLSLSGLYTGQKIKIPGDKIQAAINNLWKQGMFEDVRVVADQIKGNTIFLTIHLVEKPRLSKFIFTKGSVKKSEADDIRDKIKLTRGKTVTENLIVTTQNSIKDFFVAKGYLDAVVTIAPPIKDSTISNSVLLEITVKKGHKVKIGQINFYGVTEFKKAKLYRSMKDTKRKLWWNIFNSGKYVEADYEKDKKKLLDMYYDKGRRDAYIVKDTIYRISPKRLAIDITFDEGKKYYFRNISWVGNSKYTSKELSAVLGIKKGDVYSQTQLDQRLISNQSGTDVSSLYMDDGYLFFSATPVEALVENDSIDLEIHINEGKQATINKVTVVGNTKTNDRVVMREIRTRPGQLFSRSDIIRTQRELTQLGYFDPEKMNVTPTPNPANGTVDIEYTVAEKASDQIELSGGFGGGYVVGTLGVSFNNFSARNMFKRGAWAPLPSGDGQKLSIRAQSYGLNYQTYSTSFTEPWLGGKKPNSLSSSVYYSVFADGTRTMSGNNGEKIANPDYGSMKILGASVGLGQRLKKPDDYFQLYTELAYQFYNINNYRQGGYVINNGRLNNLNLKSIISRNSINTPLNDYPTGGSSVTFTAQASPPWSNISGKDLTNATKEERYKWLEMYKFKFATSWFTQLLGRDRKHALVLNTRLGWGYLGYYNDKIGLTPFDRFSLGGNGFTGFNAQAREIIGLRGYEDNIVYSGSGTWQEGSASIAKYTMELRYPVSLNPSALIYGLVFAEAGNAWANFKEFNPFSVKRSAGVGVRIFLPMFGLLGFDYGWRFDDAPGMKDKSKFHFSIGMNLGEL